MATPPSRGVIVYENPPRRGPFRTRAGQVLQRLTFKPPLKSSPSVTAAALRYRIISQLRPPTTIPIPLDWIYQNPSIDAMSAVLCSSPTAPRPVSIPSMIDKYSSRITPNTRAEPTSITCNVVLLTGSTGALGSQLLAQLIVRTDVDTIYCLNRPGTSGEGLLERHQKTFRTFSIDVTLLQSPKVHLISTNLTDSSLGLAPETIHAVC